MKDSPPTPLKLFETHRLILQPTSVDDALLIHRTLNTPKFLQYVGDRQIRTIADATVYIQANILPQIQQLGYGSYTIVRKDNKVKIGVCGLYDRKGVEGIDIGFGLLPEYEGFGFAFEATQRLLKAAFTDFRLKELKAITCPFNTGSQKLLKKLGFSEAGTMLLPHESEELLLFIHKGEELI